jgi:hypothetical protein
LASAVEAAADRWSGSSLSPLESLREWNPAVAKLLEAQGEDHARDVARRLSKTTGATGKFTSFILKYRPPPPEHRPPPFNQVDWDESAFSAAIKKVYRYRSSALHGGKPFPAPLLWVHPPAAGHPIERPAGASGTGIHNWASEDLPCTIHIFEYIVRNSILNWWKSLPLDQAPAATA